MNLSTCERWNIEGGWRANIFLQTRPKRQWISSLTDEATGECFYECGHGSKRPTRERVRAAVSGANERRAKAEGRAA